MGRAKKGDLFKIDMDELCRENRIRELDFARGVALFIMLVLHGLQFSNMFGTVQFTWPDALYALKKYGGAFFVFLSGVCASLGKGKAKRALVVLACAFLLTAVTEWLYISGREDPGILIRWGVLHLIGFCKLLWPALKKLPSAVLIISGLVIVITGYILLSEVRVENPYLLIFGLQTRFNFCFDYFPILPHMGWFLLGSGLGKIIYKDGKALFPGFREGFFSWIGRNSLLIYMGHLPFFYILFKLI